MHFLVNRLSGKYLSTQILSGLYPMASKFYLVNSIADRFLLTNDHGKRSSIVSVHSSRPRAFRKHPQATSLAYSKHNPLNPIKKKGWLLISIRNPKIWISNFELTASGSQAQSGAHFVEMIRYGSKWFRTSFACLTVRLANAFVRNPTRQLLSVHLNERIRMDSFSMLTLRIQCVPTVYWLCVQDTVKHWKRHCIPR